MKMPVLNIPSKGARFNLLCMIGGTAYLYEYVCFS